MSRTAAKTDRKAEGFAMLAAGATLDEVAEKTSTAKSTVQGWAKAVKEITGQKPSEVRINDFDEAVQRAAAQLMQTLTAQMELAGDKNWLMSMTAKQDGTRDVVNFTKAITERFTLIVQFASMPPDQRQSLEQSNTVEAEIVDA